MLQGLRQCRLLDIGRGPGAERPARGGDDDADQLIAIARSQGLEQGIVLGIRGQNAGAGFSPAAPETAAITQSAGRAAASMIALSPAPYSIPVPAKASRNSLSRAGSATAAKRTLNS